MKHSLSSVMPFGKYRGLTVEAVTRINPRYLGWAVHNVDGFDLDAEARKVGQRAINVDEQFAINQQNAWAWGFGRDAKEVRQKVQMKRIVIEREEREKAGLASSDRFSYPEGYNSDLYPRGDDGEASR